MRRVTLVLFVALTLLATSGCSAGKTDSSPEVVEPGSAVDPPAKNVSSDERATEEPDGRALLSSSLALYREGYKFEAVAEVQGSEAVVIDGFVVGQSAQMTITSGDATVSHVITPNGSWGLTDGGDWEEVDPIGPIERPLEDLASPTSITILSTDNIGIAAVGVYDGAAFGSDDPIEMSLHFDDGRLVSASYETESASISTAFSPLDGESIETPSASP